MIRLEERIRLAAILPEPLRSRIDELTDSQLVGLRFASDAELPALTQRALDEKLSRGDIKKAITDWRPDHSQGVNSCWRVIFELPSFGNSGDFGNRF